MDSIPKVNVYELKVPVETWSALIPDAADVNNDGYFTFREVQLHEVALKRFRVDIIGEKYLNCRPFDQNDLFSDHATYGAKSLGIFWSANSKQIAIVSKGSLAEKAGIREGDYLLAVNGVSTDVNSDLGFAMIGKCGDTVTIEAFRPDVVGEADFMPNLVGLKNLFNIGSVFGAYSVDIKRTAF